MRRIWVFPEPKSDSFFFLLHMPSDSQDGSSNLLIDTKDSLIAKETWQLFRITLCFQNIIAQPGVLSPPHPFGE